ncbi:MAG: CRISPR-associated endonuclease Cas1 [Bacillota bacterium]
MHVTVDEYGTFLGKKSERLVIRVGKEVTEHALRKVSEITVVGSGISLSTDLVYECTERGIQLNFLSFDGKPYAKMTSPALSATVITRREQLLAYTDSRGVCIARACVEGKIRNQANLVKYYARSRKRKTPEAGRVLEELAGSIEHALVELQSVSGSTVDDIRLSLMNIEARASKSYWAAFGLIIPDGLGFRTREHQGAPDLVNSLLNYGYGVLYSQVWGAVLLAGLEPFAGFLHVDRPGKPSLILDLIEEFRQPVVDRVVLAWLSKATLTYDPDEGLSKEIRRELADRVLRRLDETDTFKGKKHSIRAIMQFQARNLASFVRGEGTYKPYVAGW